MRRGKCSNSQLFLSVLYLEQYLSMKKEREATEPKEANSEEQKTRNAGKDAKNPCRQSGCSAPAGPGSIFCGSDCLGRHVAQSIKLLSQDRRMMYNRSQQPEKASTKYQSTAVLRMPGTRFQYSCA